MGKRAVFKKHEFGIAIKNYRVKKSITLEVACADTEIPRSVFHRIEQGYMPKLEHYATIMTWMGEKSLKKFFTDSDTEQLKNI